MSRTTIPFATHDISALARSLHEQLGDRDSAAGHVELLNILARSAGYWNIQSLRAQAAAHDLLTHPQPPKKPVDYEQVNRLARFLMQGACWRIGHPRPASRRPVRVLWSRVPSHRTLTEEQLNKHICANHLFGDPALPRRQLCDLGLVSRTADGREYRRVERQPSGEVLALIRQQAGRRPEARAIVGSSSTRRAL